MSGEKRRLQFDIPVPVTPVKTGPQTINNVKDVLASKLLDAVGAYALVNAMFTLSESKLIDDLRRDHFLHAPSAAEKHGYDHRHTVGLLRFLATQDFLREETDEMFHLTPMGHAATSRAALSFVQTHRGGYGELMMRSKELMDKSIKYGKDITRNGHYTSYGSSMITSSLIDEVPHQVLEAQGAKVVADLGCGSGQFLIDWVKRHPDHRGIGVDIAPEAVRAGNEAAARAGVSEKIAFLEADGFDLRSVQRECSSVDIFYSFAMEHETFRDGENAVLSHIDGMAELFPGKRYLLGEPQLWMSQMDGFFFWIHSLSMQGFPRNVMGWYDCLKKLQKTELEEVFVPDHGKFGNYFMLKFRG